MLESLASNEASEAPPVDPALELGTCDYPRDWCILRFWCRPYSIGDGADDDALRTGGLGRDEPDGYIAECPGGLRP